MARGILSKNLIHGTKSDLQGKRYNKSERKREASQADKITLAKQLIVTLDRYTLADAGYLKPHLASPRHDSGEMGTA